MKGQSERAAAKEVQSAFPTEAESSKQLRDILHKAQLQKEAGREIVVVIGLGFVGTVMAAVVADAVDKDGNPSKFVIGLQRPSAKSYWKIPALNGGESPLTSEDPEVPRLIRRCVIE